MTSDKKSREKNIYGEAGSDSIALGSSVPSSDRITSRSIFYYRVLHTLGNLE